MDAGALDRALSADQRRASPASLNLSLQGEFMATSKPAPSEKPVASTPKIVAESGKEALHQAIQVRVAERAYSLYEASGREEGNAERHWLQAEDEILQQGLEVRESGSWLSINASLPDVSAEDMEIYVEPEQVIVRAQKREISQDTTAQAQSVAQAEVFLARSLPVEVEPSTASAAFKDQKLTLMVKKRYPEGAKNTPSARSAS
jgi:HSP20 family molecular chaperone IbpA